MSDENRGGLDEEEWAYYADGAWYDAEYVHIGGDVFYYSSVAADCGGRVLELACGTGRLSIPMAQCGVEVTGIDVAPGMIHRAEEKRAELPEADRDRLRFMLGDMRSVRLGETFDVVILAFNTLMHMTSDADLEGALRTAHAHLKPTGRFYFDLFTPHPGLFKDRPEHGRFDPQEMIDPRTGQRFIVTENNSYDARRQINLMRFFYQQVDGQGRKMGAERMLRLKMRVLFPRELDSWLQRTGFEIIEDWDDFERSRPFSGLGGRRVVVARPQRSTPGRG